MLSIMQQLLPDIPDMEIHLDSEYSTYDIQQEIIIEQFFAEQSPRKVSIEDLAQMLYPSSRQVNRNLHSLYGCSFTSDNMRRE